MGVKQADNDVYKSVTHTVSLRGVKVGMKVLICTLLAVTVISQAVPATGSHSNKKRVDEDSTRPQYHVDLAIDFDAGTYSGSELVNWTNNGDHPATNLFFHLYPNVRSEPQGAAPSPGTESANPPDEPRLEITEIKTSDGHSLPFGLDDQATTLRVYLREPVQPGGSTAVRIKIKGTVPDIDPEETSLVTHVMRQVSAAIKNEREVRRARELNFRSRGVMLLGTAFPLLAVHDGDDWRRKIEPGIGELVFSEAADYQVTVSVGLGVSVYTPALENPRAKDDAPRSFSASSLREFPIVAARNLKVAEKTEANTHIRSVFLPEHERVGLRVLAVASNALRVYQSRFGALPFNDLAIAETPLVAGLGSADFSGFAVIASAFYVDFESPAMRNMPEIIRDQRGSVEDSLEWTVARLVAHQWWSAAVGTDPVKQPVLNEALASWSALLYYQQVYGAQRAAAAQQDQLSGVYRLYRTFGGEDMSADHSCREYRNSFQYAAIVMTKGGLMLEELRKFLGDDRFFTALQKYYKADLAEIADVEELRAALIAEAPIEQRRTVSRIFNRWLSSKRGDEDIAPPDNQLAVSLGLPSRPEPQKGGDKNAFNVFGRLGKFFWQQMTRIP